MDAIEVFALLFGVVLILSGYRAIRKRATHTNLGWFTEDGAIRLGWFWIALGVVLLAGIIFDISLVKSFLHYTFDPRP